jgi:transcriptional regulator with XRE-family HTH domain
MQQETLPTLGAEVRRHRNIAGMSQEVLAEKLGISREAVSQIERGEIKRPNNEVLEKLETTIGLSRLRAYQLMGAISDLSQSDPALLIQQIAALPNHEDRFEAWKQLPESLRQAITVLMKDVLQESALRL